MTGLSPKSKLKLSILTTFDDLEAIESEWDKLQQTSLSVSLTNSFSYVYMAYKHFLKSTDQLHFITLHSTESSQLVAIFPFVVSDESRYKLNFRRLSFIGLNKFKKPTPLIDENHIDECWQCVLNYTLKEKKVWQIMDVGEGGYSPLRDRNGIDRVSNMSILKQSNRSIVKPCIKLNQVENKNDDSYFIEENCKDEHLLNIDQEVAEYGCNFRVHSGEDLDYCYSQVMHLVEKNNKQTEESYSSTNSIFDFYQKYFCRMAYKKNITFGLLSKDGEVVSIDIAYTENGRLYLDSNVVNESFLSFHVDVLSLNLLLKYYSKKGYSDCEFLCAKDSRIPYLKVDNRQIEKQTLSRVCPKFMLISTFDHFSELGNQMQFNIRKMLGMSEKAEA